MLLFEIGRIAVHHDPELDHLYAVIPLERRPGRGTLEGLRDLTMDPWRYVEGLGLVLDLSAWFGQSGLSAEELRARLEGKYGELAAEVARLLERAEEERREAEKKRRRRRRRARRRARRKRGRG